MSECKLIDLEKITTAISTMFEPEEVIEIRALNVLVDNEETPRKAIHGYFQAKHIDYIEFELNRCNSWSGCYVNLNKIGDSKCSWVENKWDLDNGFPYISKADISNRKYILIDFDPDRSSNESSSKEELKFASVMGKQCLDFLTTKNFPRPIIAMSGNGAHLLYPSDVNDEELVRKFLNFLADKFSDDTCHVDRVVYKTAQIVKLYGTRGCKGEPTSDHPWRMSSIKDSGVKTDYKVTAEMLMEITANYEYNTERTEGVKISDAVDSNLSDMHEVEDYLDSFCTKHKIELARKKNSIRGITYTLQSCPWGKDHTKTNNPGDSAFHIIQDGSEYKLGFSCFHNSCNGKGWKDVRRFYEPHHDILEKIKPTKTADELVEDGVIKPDAKIEDVINGEVDDLFTERKIMAHSLSDYQRSTDIGVPHMISGFLPNGVSLISSPPKVGKSSLAYQFAASLITKKTLFGDDRFVVNPKKYNVCIMSLEESIEEVMDRLIAQFGNDRSIYDSLTIIDQDSNFEGMDSKGIAFLIELIKEKKINCFILDVWEKGKPQINSKEANIYKRESREWQVVKEFASKYKVDFVIMHHTNKMQIVDSVQAKISGSQAMRGGPDTVIVLQYIDENTGTVSVTFETRKFRCVNELKKIVLQKTNEAKFKYLGMFEDVVNKNVSDTIVRVFDKLNPETGYELETNEIMGGLHRNGNMSISSPLLSYHLRMMIDKNILSKVRRGVYRYNKHMGNFFDKDGKAIEQNKIEEVVDGLKKAELNEVDDISDEVDKLFDK